LSKDDLEGRLAEKVSKAERSFATRASLLATARRLFAENGYASTSTDDLVRQAGVTRGALYYHFRDKKTLFRAIDEAIEAELASSILTAASQKTDPWDQVVAGSEAFLDAALDPAVQRIVLVDAPSVLGWEVWREIDAKHGLGLLEVGIKGAMDAGRIRKQPVKPLAHLLLGALGEACLIIARAADVPRAREEVGTSVRLLLEALAAPPEATRKKR